MTPRRTCVTCRTEASRGDLLRMVLGPDGELAIDFSQRLPGRGAYVCWTRDCLDGAFQKGRLTRALRQPVPSEGSEGTRELVRRHLERHLAETCALARKSGALKSGAHTVEMAFRRGWARMGMTTSDAGADTIERAQRMCRRAGVEWHSLPLTSEQFGRAVGKGIRSVAAMGDGPLAGELERSLQRHRGLL